MEQQLLIWMGGSRRRLMSGGNVDDRTNWAKLEDNESSDLARRYSFKENLRSARLVAQSQSDGIEPTTPFAV